MKYNKQTKNSMAQTQTKANSSKSKSTSAPVRQQKKQTSGKPKMQEQEITINLGRTNTPTVSEQNRAKQIQSKQSNNRPQTANRKKKTKKHKAMKQLQKSSSYDGQPLAKTSREQMRKSNAVRHKRRTKKNYTLHYLLLIILLTITIVTLSYTVLFNIKSIEITDNSVLTDEQILKAANIKIGDNLLKINKNKAELKILNATIYFDRVKLVRKFPSKLSIDLDVAKPVTGVKYSGMYYYFSENKRLIEIEKTDEGIDVPVAWGIDLKNLKLGDYLIENEDNGYETVQMINGHIEDAEIEGITAVDIRNPANIKLYFDKRIEIQLGSLQDIDYKLRIAKEILDNKTEPEEVGILDVQITGKAYFRVAENTSQPK